MRPVATFSMARAGRNVSEPHGESRIFRGGWGIISRGKGNPIPLTLLLSLLVSRCLPAAELRGLWVDSFGPGFYTAQEATKLVQDCRKYNFNALFLEVRRRADAFYLPHPPNEDPHTWLIAPGFDPLAQIIRDCHQASPRIQVHCWLVSYMVWSDTNPPPDPNHVFHRHPEYLTRDAKGNTRIGSGYYLDPGNLEACQSIYNAARDLVTRYDIDGIHWDYHRYPSRDSGYNPAALKRFNDEFKLTGQPAPTNLRFSEWRRRQVTDFLRWTSAGLLELKPSLLISATVIPSLAESSAYRFANWPAWTREGIIDLAIPMYFTTDTAGIFDEKLREARLNQGSRAICIGQGAYLNSPENTLLQLLHARDQGFPGTVYYSYRTPSSAQMGQEQVLALVKSHFQTNWTDPPAFDWKTTKAILKGTVTASQTRAPVYNATLTLDFSPKASQKTEAHGTYAFLSLGPGVYRVSAEAPGLGKAAAQVELKAGQVLNANLVLAPQE